MKLENSSVKPVTSGLFKNTSYNLLTQGFLVLIAIWAIPILVHKLGDEKFGILTLLWALVGYFSFLDLGISRANTKYLSEAITLSDKNLSARIVWTSLTFSAGIGILSMLVVFLGTPFLLLRVFKVTPLLYGETSRAFFYAALSIPFMLIYGTVKGVQMAFLRFDLVNAFQGGMSAFQWVGSVVLVWLGMGLQEIVFMTFLLRMISAVTSFSLLSSQIPSFFQSINLWDKVIYQKLLKFGGWVSVSQLISPLFMYLDKILIGSFLTLTAVAYYSVPQEAFSRLLIIPMSLSIVLFPIFSGQTVLEENLKKMSDLYFRSVKYLILLILPVTLFLIIYAKNILYVWVGAEYCEESSLVFQIIACGFFFNSLAQIPATILHAFGRPDLTAKFHLLELPLMVLMNVILIPWIGIIGAGIAWSIRVALDAFLLFLFAHKYVEAPILNKNKNIYFYTVRYELLFIIIVFIALLFVNILIVKLTASFLFTLVYISWVWYRGFDEKDRTFFVQLRSRFYKVEN
jgi:O-antigen/teichoic acid export membrane protein